MPPVNYQNFITRHKYFVPPPKPGMTWIPSNLAEQAPGTSIVARVLYTFILMYEQDTGAFPTIEQLANDMDISRARVIKHLKKLREAELIFSPEDIEKLGEEEGTRNE